MRKAATKPFTSHSPPSLSHTLLFSYVAIDLYIGYVSLDFYHSLKLCMGVRHVILQYVTPHSQIWLSSTLHVE